MHKIARFLLLFSFCLTSSIQANTPQAQTELTIIGDRNYAPYSYETNGVPTGLYVDILRAVFDRLDDYQLTFSMDPWKRGLSMIKEGTHLAIFPPYYWPEKRPFISVYSEPIYKEQVVSICHKERIKFTNKEWPLDYQGLKVGTNRGFLSPGAEFFELVTQGKITLVETQNSKTALRLLSLKRIDCYVNSKLTINWTLNALMKSAMYKDLLDNLVYTSLISENNAYIGYSKRYLERHPKDKELIKRINQTIRKMRDTGALAKILQHFLANP